MGKKYKIVSNNKLTEGLFGQIILYVLEALPVLRNEGIDPDNVFFDITTRSYGNVFPGIFRTQLDNKGEFDCELVQLNELRLSGEFQQYTLGNDFLEINNLWNEYFILSNKFNPNNEEFKNYLGVHFRGGDKLTDTRMNTPLHLVDFIDILDSFLNLRQGDYEGVYIASDEGEVVEKAIKKRWGHLKTYRDDTAIKSTRHAWRGHKAPEQSANGAITDMLNLANCKTVLKSSSALSAFSKVFNPMLEIYRINACKIVEESPYFPDAYIPLLPCFENFPEKTNKIVKSVQREDWAAHKGTQRFLEDFAFMRRTRWDALKP